MNGKAELQTTKPGPAAKLVDTAIASSNARHHVPGLKKPGNDESFDAVIGCSNLQKTGNTYAENKSTYNFSDVSVYAKQSPVIQAKLSVNMPCDEYEQEADAVADKIMRMPDKNPVISNPSPVKIQRKCATCGNEVELQEEKDHAETDSIITVHRKCAACEEEEEKPMQRKESRNTAPAVSGNVQQVIQSQGQPLDRSTRSFMESRFGFDFGKVQIHNNSLAHQSAKDINALAYTHQHHIAFGAGQYQPQTESGKKLLAHELTHVVQQGGKVYRKEGVEEPTQMQEEVPVVETVNPDDPEVVEQFTLANRGLSKVNLVKWIKSSIASGWKKGDIVPDYKIPTINFKDDGEPVIEAVDFRGDKGAFNTASKILPRDVGAKFWWKQRFTETLGEYKLDYASDKAYKNLQLHEKLKDVDFEALRTISGDLSTYREVMQISSYTDRLLSAALVRLIAETQAKLYPNALDKQTGILDSTTQSDIQSKIAADKKAAAQAAEAAQSTSSASGDAAKPDMPLPGPIHDVIRKIIVQLESDIKAPVPTMITATEMLGSIPLSPFPDIPAEFIYRVEQHFMLGILKQIETLPEQEIKDKFWHLLGIQFTPGYIWGNLIGIPQGIWSWVKDMAELVWDLIKLPYTLIKYTVTELPGDIKSAYDSASMAMDWFMSNKQLVFSFVKDLVAGPGNDMAAIEDAIKSQIYGMAEGAGATVLGQMSDFASKSNQEIGESIGKIAGYVLPDILLAVFSEGIGTALKGAFQSVKIFIEAGRAGAMTLKVLEMGKSAFAAIEKFLEGAKIFANKAYGEVKTMLRSILEYFKKILGIEEKALSTVKTAKTAETVVEEGRAISKLETTADDALKKDAKKHADDVVEEGPEKQSKAKILAKAIVIAEVADALDLPITGVIAELDLLKSINPNVSFEKTGTTDPYQIWMIGSRYLVDGNYTARSSKKKPFADDEDFHQDLLDQESVPGVDTPHSSKSPSDLENLPSKKGTPHQKGLHSADLGVAEGKLKAEQDGLTFVFDNPRGMEHNVPGIDSVYRDAGNNLVVVEFKGGEATLAEGQMTRDWVIRKIEQMEANPSLANHPVVKELRQALTNRKLYGRTYYTRVEKTTGQVLETILENHGLF